MKRITSILIIILAITLITGCKDGDKTDAPKKSSVKIDDNNDANSIIEFNNKFLQLTKGHEGLINGLNDYFTRVNSRISDPENPFNIRPMKPMYISTNIYKVKEVPAAFGKVRDDMQKNYDAMNTSFDAIANSVNDLDSYISAEDYKDDKGAKAKEIQDKASKALQEYYAASKAVMAALRPVADDAEAVTLKDHPLKKYILSGKKVLSASDELLDEVYHEFDTQKLNEAKMQELYSKLEVAAKDVSDMSFSAPDQYKSRESSFTNFKKEANEFAGSVRKLMRDAKEKGKLEDTDVRLVENAYQSMLNRYNTFVD